MFNIKQILILYVPYMMSHSTYLEVINFSCSKGKQNTQFPSYMFLHSWGAINRESLCQLKQCLQISPMCKAITRQFPHFPQDGRNMVKTFCIKHIINTKVHLLVIYKFWIRLMQGKWNILKKVRLLTCEASYLVMNTFYYRMPLT